jgi:hypothetical protein
LLSLSARPGTAGPRRLGGGGYFRPFLEQDDFSLNRHPPLASCVSMIFSENRCALFGIMP